MEIRYQYFAAEQLLFQKFVGLFSPDHYMRQIGRVYANLKLDDIKRVILDFRDLKISESGELPDDFEEKLTAMVKFRKNVERNMPVRSDVRVVFWVDKPLPTVVAHLFVEGFSQENYYYCSTEEKILKTLKINPGFDLAGKANQRGTVVTDL